MLIYIIPSWVAFMGGYGIYKRFVSKKKCKAYNNDLSSRVRKIKLKNDRYINTKPILK